MGVRMKYRSLVTTMGLGNLHKAAHLEMTTMQRDSISYFILFRTHKHAEIHVKLPHTHDPVIHLAPLS